MIPQGYKQTEIGVIPEDWEIKYLDEFGDVISGGTPSTSIKDYWDGDIAWCTPSDITATKGKYISKTARTITGKGLQNSAACILPPESILLCTRATIGELKLSKVPMSTNQGFKNLRFNGTANTGYLYYLLQTKKKDMLELAIGSTFLEISKKALCSIALQTPFFDEQKRIAEALSDVDSMISSLEKLIAKKKAIKQGAMQELLTGKKRLPGFDGDIEYKSLASLCTVFADGDWIESKDQSNDGIRLIQTGNIGVGKYLDKTDKQRFISTDTFDLLKCLEIFENDVIVSRLPEPAGRACILPHSNKRRITAVDCTIIRFADYNPILFVAYSQTKQYQDKIDMAMAGSTRQRISRKELGEIPIPVFPTIEEQNALASIFSDMDNEIEALEQKLAKTRQIKQGMMQQLLTGKIRLV